jgi:hypothetical protein
MIIQYRVLVEGKQLFLKALGIGFVVGGMFVKVSMDDGNQVIGQR